MRRAFLFAGAVAIVGVVVLVSRKPTDPLEFLQSWNPITETRVGDWAHPNDAAFGSWTVLRFPGSPRRFTAYDERPAKRGAGDLPDLEGECLRRISSAHFSLYAPYDAPHIGTISDSAGGRVRYLVVRGAWDATGDEYQIWERNESWLRGLWRSLTQRIGI